EAVEPAATTAPTAPPAEQLLEQIGEVAAADVPKVHADVAVTPAAAAPADVLLEPRGAGHVVAGPPVAAQPVVLRSLVRIAQHLVGLRDLLEAILGRGVLVDVGMVLPGEPA